MKTLKDLPDLQGKRVFYRPDYNVPLLDGKISDDFRILATVPTIDALIAKGAKIIIGAHLGRPDGVENPEFSLLPVAERLADLYEGKQVVRIATKFSGDEVTAAIAEMAPGDLLILPNLRFNPGEEANDPAFAKELASLGDVYVNDAFAVDHRDHASLTGVPKLIPCFAGNLLEQELTHLGSLVAEPAKPFVVIMGGAKVSEKIEVIKRLAAVADHVLIGGAMANTFLLAMGQPVGDSKVEADKVDLAKSLLEEFKDKLVLAADFVKDDEAAEKFKYLDIGPKAVEQFKDYLNNAKTIFWNGSLGYTEDPRYAKATQEIAEYVASLKDVTSIVAGGDTVEMVTRLNLHDSFTFVSTGGGAALDLLAGVELPAVTVLG
jgi:phosphoglycerate kinase